MKRRLLILLCFSLLIGVCTQSVFALSGENTPTVICESKECYPGDTVALDISISGNPGTMYLEMSTDFAEELGECKVTNGGIFADFTEGRQYMWVADEDVPENGKLAALQFSVPETLAPGEYRVGFIFRSAFNYAENRIIYSVTYGTVKVLEPETECLHPNKKTAVIENSIKATCTKSGSYDEVVYCADCKAEVSRVTRMVPALNHTYKTVTTKATLTKNGKTETKCSVCGNVKSTTAIACPKTFTLSATKFTYTGKAIKPTVTVKDSKGKVIASSNYTVSYSNNTNAGTAKVTIKFKGNYSGTKTVNFTITPKQATGLKVSDEKTTSLKLTWSKTAGAKYYKVEQSTDGKKWKTVTTTDKTSYTVKSLKAGTKYQFRVTALDSTKKIAGKTSSVLKTGTLTKAPALTLKSTKSKTATASWKKVTGAKKYVVYKSTNGKKWTKVTTTTKTSYNLTKLTGGKKIYVKITALNAYSKASAASQKNVKVKK